MTAARLYRGHVMHMRLQPKRHRFRYRVFSLLVDLDRLEDIERRSWLLQVDRFGLFSIDRRDHGARDGSDLRAWADDQVAGIGLSRPARIEMLSFPRMLGYVFNPLTVYYCYDAADALTAVIYEVKNTFGDQVAYALPPGAPARGTYRHSQTKEMYVSPFIDMDQTYRFSIDRPGDRLAVRIRQGGAAGEELIATHTARGKPLTDRRLAGVFFAYPMMTFWVVAVIHWHALRLFLKGVRYRAYADRAAGEKASV
ncbi:MAG: DUF1365 domain-containing protein [Pseudomonadota bacterium]